MSFDSLLKQLQAIQGNMKSYDADAEWNKTISGRIFASLESLQKEFHAQAKVEKKGGPHEIFWMGNEKANLYKVMRGGGVAEDGGTIHTYVESWEYKEFKWWAKALESAHVTVDFLGTPVAKLAEDARIADFEHLFVPAAVIQKYHLNPTGDESERKVMEEWVYQQIKQSINPLVKPDYEVIFYEHNLRLQPLTTEALQSLVSNNATYQKAQKAIGLGLAALRKRFELKEASLAKQKA